MFSCCHRNVKGNNLQIVANEYFVVNLHELFWNNTDVGDQITLLTWISKLMIDDVAYLRISKVSIYISSPQGLVRYHGLFNIDYHFKLKE